VLLARGLTKRYGDVIALAGVDIDVRPGRIVGFLGPNGAGKTTAMRCIMGLAEPDSGKCTWDEHPLDRGTRLRFGYMPEERGLYPKMRIGEQLIHFARLSGLNSADAQKATRSWLERLDLGDRSDSKLEELSHGNQQRVQLAAALVHDPTLAVLDEPFSGLDPIAVETMADTLRDLAKNGTAILFSSHQLDLVEDVCQDVVVIDHGRVVLTGELDDLRSRSTSRILEVRVSGAPWVPPPPALELENHGGSRRRYLVDAGVDVEAILAAANQSGVVEAFSFEPPNLSDLFREAVSP
jgi:ABC-2 type transport system ATP-binding protein